MIAELPVAVCRRIITLTVLRPTVHAVRVRTLQARIPVCVAAHADYVMQDTSGRWLMSCTSHTIKPSAPALELRF